MRTTSPTTLIPLRCWSRKALPAIQMMPQGGEKTQKKERGEASKVSNQAAERDTATLNTGSVSRD